MYTKNSLCKKASEEKVFQKQLLPPVLPHCPLLAAVLFSACTSTGNTVFQCKAKLSCEYLLPLI